MPVLGVVEAASELGVSQRRVRQMLADGVLDGQRVGRAWVIEQRALDRARARRRVAGRPWRAGSAWAVLALAGDEDVEISAVERSRARRRLHDDGLEGLVDQLSARAKLRRFYAHPSVLDRLRTTPGFVRSGASASPEHGLDLVASDFLEGYLQASSLAGLVDQFKLEEGHERPNIVLRLVDDDVWPFVSNAEVAPPAVVVVDLLEADDERSRRAGAELVKRL